MSPLSHLRALCALCVLCVIGLVPAVHGTEAALQPGTPAPKPLFRDPVFDGAADPVVVWNPSAQRWWMFYTNRRANVPGLSGVAWVHGTKIGIAESADHGTTWRHIGDADIELPPEIGGAEPTLWAPHVITAGEVAASAKSNLMGYSSATPQTAPADARHPSKPASVPSDKSNPLGYSSAGAAHHMFLTVVPGVFENWQHPRTIVHLTSTDLRTWRNAQPLALSSDRVIDACVFPLPHGGWRLWYNNERDRKSIYHADSPDLVTWTDRGKTTGVGERPGEGPYVFRWRGAYWMIVDLWKGLGVYRSDDLDSWTPQPQNLLATPGRGADDGVNGGHACVVVNAQEDRAFCFYFTHPGRARPEPVERAGTIKPEDKDSLELRRSSIQVVELHEHAGVLSCDRDQPTHVALPRIR